MECSTNYKTGVESPKPALLLSHFFMSFLVLGGGGGNAASGAFPLTLTRGHVFIGRIILHRDPHDLISPARIQGERGVLMLHTEVKVST